MTLKEEHNKVARTAAMIIGEGGQEVLKHGNEKELREVEDKLGTWLRISEKASDAEIKAKIKIFRESVGLPVERKEEKQNRITLEEIRKWIASVSGQFHIRDLYSWMPELSSKPPERRQISTCLGRLVKEGLLERDGRYGIYRKVDSELERMDFLNVDSKPVNLWLPFETDETESSLNDLVEIYPSNIIVIAGEKGVGKTTIAMNIAWANRNTWDISYFNSEMGKHELRKRVNMFSGTDPYEWAEKISFYPKNENFHDVLFIGPGKLNIIDYIEATGDDFPYVARWISNIHTKLLNTETICILCLQKPPGRDEAYGGTQTRNKPRLYLSVSKGKMLILDAKNWRGSENPQRRECNFKIIGGSKLLQVSPWNKTDKWSL